MGIYLVIAVVVGFTALYFWNQARLEKETQERVESPVRLHDKHGGSMCANPDWFKVRDLFTAALIEGGLDTSEYSDHVNNPRSIVQQQDNIRTHYIRFGDRYPSNVSPC